MEGKMKVKHFLNRREFLLKGTKGTIGLTAGIAASGAIFSCQDREKVVEQKNKNSIKLSLFSVTFTGVWYDGPGLNIKEFIRKAKSIGYNGVELGGKRPHLSPLDYDEKECAEIRKLADSEGIEIAAVASYNNFASPIPERRENELLMVREQMRTTSYLGVKILRLMAAWTGVTIDNGKAIYDEARKASEVAFPDVTKEQKWKWCRECLEESVKYAEKFGITLVFQNHKPLIDNYRDAIKMVNEIGSENLKLSLDVPLFYAQDDEYVRNAVLEAGKDLIVHSHVGGEFYREENGKIAQRVFGSRRNLINYPVFVKTLTEIGYNGYLSYELCHPFKIGNKYAKLEDSEEQAAFALEYIRNILSEVV